MDRPKFLWISTNPSLKYFHRHLLKHLSKVVPVELWEYCQTLDEGSSIEGAVKLLDEYLANLDTPVHLIGHGIGGVVALCYARTYPHRVASLTLLSVAAQPSINWHSYYYAQLQSLPGSRKSVLKSISTHLFPDTCARHICDLVDRLDRDLVEAPSNHSLFHLDILAEGGVEMPLMVCGDRDDPVITDSDFCGWHNYLKSTDKIWRTQAGGHFFHHTHFELTSDRIHHFWRQLEPQLAVHPVVEIELN